MGLCPCCKEYGDVWEVVFRSLNDRRGVMCFECDTVWDSIADAPDPAYSDFETLMKEHGFVADWKLATKLRQVSQTPPEASSPTSS
ncbi:MAG: hypothetical protein JWN70_3417 [Planctomycetaceae bacterium]|nr:hypothetical protein [Planctomycetaceae bacterium]